jgi:hypothetical protein
MSLEEISCQILNSDIWKRQITLVLLIHLNPNGMECILIGSLL